MYKNNKQVDKQKVPRLLFIAVPGEVYGDIGTSPLCALLEAFSSGYGEDHIFAVPFLIFWALILIITVLIPYKEDALPVAKIINCQDTILARMNPVELMVDGNGNKHVVTRDI